MIRTDRTTRDTQTLAGQRGKPGQRAILWQEIDQLSNTIAAKLLSSGFGKALSPLISAASIDARALESLLNRSRRIEEINQLIDSTGIFINNEAERLDAAGLARDDLITNVNVRVGEAEADILDEQIARSDGDTALGQSITTVSANLAAANAQVQLAANAIATIENYQAATYSIRLKAGGASAGFEMVAADDPINGSASAIRFQADNVLIDGTLFASHVNVDSFASAGLAVFGDALQSANYDGATVGWRITQDGTARFINLIAREAIINGEVLTEKLANLSVTIARETSGTGTQTISFYTGKTGNVVVMATAQVSKTVFSGAVEATANLLVNGSVWRTAFAKAENNQQGGATSAGSVSMTLSFGYGPQTLTFQVSGDVVSASIVVLERFK